MSDICPHRLPSLTVAISTMGSRLPGLTLPDAHAGVRYLVLVQDAAPGVADAASMRADVDMRLLDSLGLSHSRNAAIDAAETDLLLFSDDDIRLNMGGLDRLRQCLRDCGDAAMVAGYRAGRRIRRWARTPMTGFNTGRICAPELMLRPALLRRHNIRFDPGFGLGAAHGLGEEYVLVTDALRAGLTGHHLPVITGHHPGPSTGHDWQSALVAARGAVIDRVFGPAAPLVRPVYALRHLRRFQRPGDALALALGIAPPAKPAATGAPACQ